MNLRWLIALAFAGVFCSIPLGMAADSLRLEEAVARSLASNLFIAAQEADLQAVQARARFGSLSTPYSVGVDLENVGGTGSLSGLRSAETTLRLSRVIELGGKQAARQALGAAEMARQQHLSDMTRLEVASRTTGRFIAVAAAQYRLEFARQQLELAEVTRREVARGVAAARNPESDLRAAEIVVGDAELKRDAAERDLASSKVALTASWGAIKPDFLQVEGNIHVLPSIETFETLAARLPMSLVQRNAVFEADTIAAKRRVAQASAKPDIDLSLGVRRFEDLNDQGLVMSVSVPLGSKPRASYAITEADAQLTALASRQEAQRMESYQSLFGLYQQLTQARTEYEALRTRLVPKAEQAFTFARHAFDAGRTSFIELTQAQRTLFDQRSRVIDAAARYHILLVEVERLTAVDSGPTP